MASRAQQASAAEIRSARLAALAVIEGDALPLPTDPRTDPVGYTDDLPAECVLLGAQGLSEAQIAAHWAVDVEAVREWGKAHPALKAALSRARTASLAWWEEKARRAIVTGDNRFPAGAWAQVMRARFADYADHQTISVQLDLGKLVRIDLTPPGLPSQQTVAEPNALIEHGPARLVEGLTARHDPSAPALEASPLARAVHALMAPPEAGGGVGEKPRDPDTQGASLN